MRKSPGTKRTASAAKTSKSNGTSIKHAQHSAQRSNFVLCVNNGEYVDLEPRKVYALLDDKQAAEDGMVRVVDDSGEDYLYPAEFFVPVRLTSQAAKAFG